MQDRRLFLSNLKFSGKEVLEKIFVDVLNPHLRSILQKIRAGNSEHIELIPFFIEKTKKSIDLHGEMAAGVWAYKKALNSLGVQGAAGGMERKRKTRRRAHAT